MYVMLNSTRKDGNTSLSYGIEEEVLNTRKNFFEKNNILMKNTLVLKVKNTNEIVEIDDDYLDNHKDLSKEILEADAVVTKHKNIFFYLNFGDCIPLVIYDKKQEILALCHLGWHSVNNNLHLVMVKYLMDKFSSRKEDLIVELGPSIKKDSYIMENPVQLSKKEWSEFLEKVDKDTYKVDLDGYVVHSLKEIGIVDIKVSDIDTYSNDNYFSNYKENKFNLEKGRFIVGAMLR